MLAQVVGASFSTLSGSLEILPFAVLDYLVPSSLSLTSVRTALDTIMESPLLASLERVMHQWGSSNRALRHAHADAALSFYHK